MGKLNKSPLVLVYGLILLTGLLTSPSLLAQEVRLDVPFVPTPYEVIDDMLRFAELKKGDLLYDLGCGDGRIVIEAAGGLASGRWESTSTRKESGKAGRMPGKPGWKTWWNSGGATYSRKISAGPRWSPCTSCPMSTSACGLPF